MLLERDVDSGSVSTIWKHRMLGKERQDELLHPLINMADVVARRVPTSTRRSGGSRSFSRRISPTHMSVPTTLSGQRQAEQSGWISSRGIPLPPSPWIGASCESFPPRNAPECTRGTRTCSISELRTCTRSMDWTSCKRLEISCHGRKQGRGRTSFCLGHSKRSPLVSKPGLTISNVELIFTTSKTEPMAL